MTTPFAQDPNPYAASAIPPAQAPAPIVPAGPLPDRLDCMRAYNYIFENPNWFTSVLLMGVIWLAAIIPGVGIILQLFFIGYQFEVIDWLLKTQGRQYPTFEFGRFGEYLNRGLWPFLVNLVTTFVLVPVIYIGMIISVLAIAGIASLAGDDLGPIIGMVLGSIGLVAFLAVIFVVMFYMVAMLLRSGLAQDFGSAFHFVWIQDFVRRMWSDMLLAGLFMVATALVLELLGLLAFCIGILFVLPLIMLAGAHLLYQLYAIYLSRGGMPVSAKAMHVQPMPPPGMPPGYPQKPL
jgi:hypothetical protein